MFTLFMSRKNFILIALVLAFAGVYVVCFTTWFRAKTIQISHTSRPVRSARSGPAATGLSFALGDYYELTEVKVVPLAALQSDSHARPVWHLVSDSGSDDVNHFSYGENISGMDSAVEGSQAEPLESGVTYRIFVTAGHAKGQHDFQIGAPVAK
jgi:hypothetical protein